MGGGKTQPAEWVQWSEEENKNDCVGHSKDSKSCNVGAEL